MLKHLAIRDFAVVRAAELEFGAGMTVISGETGAGKSLLVDALGFLSGQRADSGMVRHGAERAELAAEFELDDGAPGRAWLREHEFDDGDGCLLRRTLRADGGSRSWINGRSATLSQLSALAAHLVEIHGQHGQQALMDRPSQLMLVDAFARNADPRARVREAAQAWAGLVRERDTLNRQGDVSDRIGYLEHQFAELDRENLDTDAIEAVMAGHRRQAHATALIEACERVATQLGGDESPSVSRQLQQVRATLARQVDHEPRLAEAGQWLDQAQTAVDETLSLVDRIRDDLDVDPSRLAELERQLERLHDLARKHRVTPAELDGRREAIGAELQALHGAGERLRVLDGEIAGAREAWRQAASRLSDTRATAAAALSRATTEVIAELGMQGGHFEVALEPTESGEPDPTGAERVEFLVSANAGQPPRPLRRVASGGELSRISLAIEVASLGLDAVPTMVFDEVDSGIGGGVAEIVGQKLRRLGARHQVLCVTHQPQVAAQGHAHYRVSKAPVEGITQSAVTMLDPRERQEELARMLGGVEVSREARAAAKRLLADARDD